MSRSSQTEERPKMSFTKLELDFIAYFMETEYEKGTGYCFHDEWNMNVTRAVISSLIKKNIIDIQTSQELELNDNEYPATWIMINMDLYDELGKILDSKNIQWRWD